MTHPHDELLILVVEDDASLRYLAQLVMESEGARVLTAADAMEGLAMVDAHPSISAIFSDVNMPGPINGHEMVVELRRRGIGIPVLLVSGAWQAGAALPDATRFIAKPYKTIELKRQIADLVAETQ